MCSQTSQSCICLLSITTPWPIHSEFRQYFRRNAVRTMGVEERPRIKPHVNAAECVQQGAACSGCVAWPVKDCPNMLLQ